MHGGENRRFLFLSIRVQHGRFAFGHSPTRPRLCADSPSPSDSESEAMKSQMLPRDASESYPPELSRAGGSWGRSRGGGPSPFAPAAAASFASSATSHELPQYVRSCLSKRLCDVAFGALYCRPTARRCPPRGFGFGAVMRRVHATRARVSCTRLCKRSGWGWGWGWNRERKPLGSRCSRRRECHGDTHGNPKRLTLQPHTLNPSSVAVSSRCHRGAHGGGHHRPKAFDPSSHGLTPPLARFVVGRRAAAFTSTVDISAGTSSRAAGAVGRGDQPERTRRCGR